MSYADVPLTRLAGTAQERIAPNPEPVALELARYAETDLLCYRASQPDALASGRQRDGSHGSTGRRSRFGARLCVTTGVMHVAQDARPWRRWRGPWRRTMRRRSRLWGSRCRRSAAWCWGWRSGRGRLDAAAAHALATLDETFQEELWGRVDEAAALAPAHRHRGGDGRPVPGVVPRRGPAG